MSINLGSNPFGLYLGNTKISEAYVGNVKVYSSGPRPLPANTLRCKFFSHHYIPRAGNTKTLVDDYENIWDIYVAGTDFSNLFSSDIDQLVSVIEANTSGVTNMSSMFNNCYGLSSVAVFDTSSVTDMSGMFYRCNLLTSVPLFDTSSVTNMSGMFQECTKLTSVPLFDTSSATNMSYMFEGCTKVESGALALYNQASTQANPPSSHTNTFSYCGVETGTGIAELYRIPSSWGGYA